MTPEPGTVIAFDAYGTLFDVAAAVNRHRADIGPRADDLVALWRMKQLEYSWVRSLMGRYRDFWSLTEEALDVALARVGGVAPETRGALLDAYRRLDAYVDVAPALARLRAGGARLAVFTNAPVAMVSDAVASADLGAAFDAIVSVDAVRIYKTAPAAYRHLCDALATGPEATTLISSNRWDIAGASAFGLHTVWLNRTNQPDEYADCPPGRVIASLGEL
jgi:2-haloacid dehalogenase